jgi:hypothetical protein
MILEQIGLKVMAIVIWKNVNAAHVEDQVV